MNGDEILALPDAPDFEEFARLRVRLLDRPDPPRDFSESNLYGALQWVYPHLAPPRIAGELPSAGLRRMVADHFLSTLGFDHRFREHCGISRGVRESLGILFRVAKRVGARIAIPSDIYPIYWKLAESAGISALAIPWSSRDGDLAAARRADWILVCDPLKPWGGRFSESLALELAAWSDAEAGRLLIADLAYDNQRKSEFLKLAKRGKACVLSSLSKGWLAPQVCGICVWPSSASDRLSGDFAKLRGDNRLLHEAIHCLMDVPERPAEVSRACTELAAAAIGAIPAELAANANFDGYFMACNKSWKDALAANLLPLPASAFGSRTPGCVFSCLPSSYRRCDGRSRLPRAVPGNA